VTLTVSTGPPPEPDPEPDTVTVPGVIGQSESRATSSIEGAGLSASVSEQTTDDQSQDGVVIDQSPGAGSELEEGGTVTIVVGRFEEEEEPVDPVDPPDEPGGGRQNPRDMPPGEQPQRRRG
jgi:serine/threonine-protein kinase